jgi:hypothetical protein
MPEINPYKSPEADLDKQARHFRWRIVPTTLIAIFAAIHLLAACVMGLQILRGASPVNAFRSLGISLIFICGITGCVSAAAWWKGRWWRAVLGTLAWVLLWISAVIFVD